MWATDATITIPCPAPPPVQVQMPPLMFGTALPGYVLGWGIAIIIGVLFGIAVLIAVHIENKTERVKAIEQAKLDMAKLSYGSVSSFTE